MILDRRVVYFYLFFVFGDWLDIVGNVNKVEFVYFKYCVIYVFFYLNFVCCVWIIDICFFL